MKLPQISLASAIALLLFYLGGCSTATGPNEIDGETDLALTEVGNEFPVSLSSETFVPGLSGLEDSVVIIGRDGDGIVTVSARVEFDSLFVEALDSVLGTSALPDDLKRTMLDTYLDRYGATIDTTDKEAMTAEVVGKMKVTSEGIQEFLNSGGDLSRPFTIVKYDASVGDTWSFTTDDGRKITRTVTYRSSSDDYPVAFWLLKVIKVEETSEDPVVEKVTYYANHKFGLVGVEVLTKSGENLEIGILPPTL